MSTRLIFTRSGRSEVDAGPKGSCAKAFMRAAGALLVVSSCALASQQTTVQVPPPAPKMTTLEEAMEDAARKLIPPERTVVAVFPFPERGVGTTLLGDYIAEKLMNALAGAHVELVERGRLDTVRKEQLLGAAGELDDSTAASLGNLAGAESVVVGTLTDLGGGTWELSTRLLGATDARIQTAADTKFASDSLPPGLAGRLSGTGAGESKSGAGASGGNADPCGEIRPWVAYVEAAKTFSKMARNTYLEVKWRYGANIWVELEVDGRAIPICGEKHIVNRDDKPIELAPPTSKVFILVEDPGAKLQLARKCWAYNEVTKQYYPYKSGDVDRVSGGYAPLFPALSCGR